MKSCRPECRLNAASASSGGPFDYLLNAAIISRMSATQEQDTSYEHARQAVDHLESGIDRLKLPGLTAGICRREEGFEAMLFVSGEGTNRSARALLGSIPEGDMVACQASPKTGLTEQPPLEEIRIGEIYRLRRGLDGGYNHIPDYDEGRFIHVQILSGPDEHGIYQGTTFGPDGKHLGPGGGWTAEYDPTACRFFGRELERIALDCLGLKCSRAAGAYSSHPSGGFRRTSK